MQLIQCLRFLQEWKEETKETFLPIKSSSTFELVKMQKKTQTLLVRLLNPALEARVCAHRESLNFRDMGQDLNEALKLSLQNRELYT